MLSNLETFLNFAKKKFCGNQNSKSWSQKLDKGFFRFSGDQMRKIIFFSQRIRNYKAFWSRNLKKFSKKIYYGNHNFNIKKWQLFSNFSVFLVTRWEKLYFSGRIRNFNVWLSGNLRKFCKKYFVATTSWNFEVKNLSKPISIFLVTRWEKWIIFSKNQKLQVFLI